MKTFCITLKNNTISEKLSQECIESGETFGWNIEIFEAISAHDISDSTWKNLSLTPSKDKKFQGRKGAQGCFLSHYHLWNTCVKINENIIILEHDAIIKSCWEPIENLDVDILKLHTLVRKEKEDIFTGKWNVGSHGYLLTPAGAEKLISWAKNNFAYHIDIMIGDKIVSYKNMDYTMVDLNKNNISTIFQRK